MGSGIEEIVLVRLSSPETKAGFVVNPCTAVWDGRKIMGEFHTFFLVPLHVPPKHRETKMLWQSHFKSKSGCFLSSLAFPGVSKIHLFSSIQSKINL